MSFVTEMEWIDGIVNGWLPTGVERYTGTLEQRTGIKTPLLLVDYGYISEETITDYPIQSNLRWVFTYLDDDENYIEINSRLESFLDTLNSVDKEVVEVSKITEELGEARITIGWRVVLV